MQNVRLTGKELEMSGGDPKSSIAIVFLLTVNDTWYPNEYPGKTCLRTVKTPPIKPDIPWNESVNIAVGECDHGPLTYTISKQLDGTHNDDIAMVNPSCLPQVMKNTPTLMLHFSHQ